jgi:hypothetical protein
METLRRIRGNVIFCEEYGDFCTKLNKLVLLDTNITLVLFTLRFMNLEMRQL